MKLQEKISITNLMPFMNFETKSINALTKIIENFRNHVNIVENLPLTKTTSYKDYEGILHNNGFVFRRIVKHGYSAFLPVLTCELDEQKQGVDLKVKIKFPNQINIGLLMFFIFNIVIFTNDFASIIMLVLPYLVILFLFNIEARFLKMKLTDIVS